MDHAPSEQTDMITEDDIAIYQTFVKEKFGVPTVVLRLESNKSSTVRVRLNEKIPAEIEPEDVGFHPDHNPDVWSVDGDSLELNAELGPNGEMTTMFATKNLSAEHSDSLFKSLEIEQVEVHTQGETATDETESTDVADAGVVADDEAETANTAAVTGPTEIGETERRKAPNSDPDTSDSVDVQPSGSPSAAAQNQPKDADSEQMPHSGDQIDNADESSVSTGDSGETMGAEQADAQQEGGSQSGDTEGMPQSLDEAGPGDTADEPMRHSSDAHANDTSTPTASGSKDEASTEEHRNKSTDEAQLSALATDKLIQEVQRRADAGELSSEAEAELQTLVTQKSDTSLASINQRLTYLQQRVGDIEAFSESIEAVHDEHGSPTEAFEEIKTELSTLSQEIEEIDERVGRVDDQPDELGPRFDTLEENVEDIAMTVSSIEEDVTELESEQDRLKSRVSELTDWREDLMKSFSNL